MNKSDYIKLVELANNFEKRASYVFDKLDQANLLPGEFYSNKMDPVSIDNITKDYIIISYYDDGYDMRDSQDIKIPVEIFLNDEKLNEYINNKTNEKYETEKLRLQMIENIKNEQEYKEYIRLKQKFEQN